MIAPCVFDNSLEGTPCRVCGRPLAKDYNKIPYRSCLLNCPHLGPPISREGITVTVKCGCSQKEHEQPHAAHECEKFKRCLPTLVPVDKAKWLARDEAAIWRCCHLCELNPRNAIAPVGG